MGAAMNFDQVNFSTHQLTFPVSRRKTPGKRKGGRRKKGRKEGKKEEIVPLATVPSGARNSPASLQPP